MIRGDWQPIASSRSVIPIGGGGLRNLHRTGMGASARATVKDCCCAFDFYIGLWYDVARVRCAKPKAVVSGCISHQ